MEVRNFSRGTFISQTKYVEDLLDGVKMLECSHLNTPITIQPIVTSFDDSLVDR